MVVSDQASGQFVETPTAVGSCRQSLRRVFYLVDSLDVGGTETQAVELALRIGTMGYEVTLGCLRAKGPLREKLRGSPVAVVEFNPRGGIDSPRGIYQTLRLNWF